MLNCIVEVISPPVYEQYEQQWKQYEKQIGGRWYDIQKKKLSLLNKKKEKDQQIQWVALFLLIIYLFLVWERKLYFVINIKLSMTDVRDGNQYLLF